MLHEWWVEMTCFSLYVIVGLSDVLSMIMEIKMRKFIEDFSHLNNVVMYVVIGGSMHQSEFILFVCLFVFHIKRQLIT